MLALFHVQTETNVLGSVFSHLGEERGFEYSNYFIYILEDCGNHLALEAGEICNELQVL